MPTYDYTLPANSTYGLYATGITLASNEYVVSVTTLAGPMRVQNVSATGIQFSARLSNVYEQKSVMMGFGGSSTPCAIGYIFEYQMTDYTHEVADASTYQYLKGETLYVNIYNSFGEAEPGSILILTPASFRITTYKPQSYTLTTAVYPTGSGTVTSTSLVEVGTSKQLTASPASGYVFDRWISNAGVFNNPNSSTTTFTMPDEDVSVYATFKPSGDILHAGRYNGTNYDPVIPMYYDGTKWIECDFKYYNSANWVDSDTL